MGVFEDAVATPASTEVGAGATLWDQFAILLRMQLARLRLAWRRYLIVSSAMPLGILILLRVRGAAPEHQALQFVAGNIVLAIAMSALTFLAQRVAWMKAHHAFDYYNTLPTSGALLLLAIFVSYFVFALPGVLAIGIVGSLIFSLPVSLNPGLVWAAATLLLAGIALSGLGAIIGLSGRDEHLAGTYGNLAMMAVLFLAIIPSSDFPVAVRDLLYLLPSTYAVDSLRLALQGHVALARLSLDLMAAALFAAGMLTLSARRLYAATE